MNRWFTYIYLFLLCICSGYARDNYDIYQKEQFKAGNGVTLNYRLLMPDTTTISNGKYPLVIFLHGSGERGDDNKSQLENGGKFFAETEHRIAYPSYIIFPQCPEDKFWSYRSAPTGAGPEALKAEPEELPIMTALEELIEEYSNLPDVDSNRIYLVGISMGGMAVYDILCRHPQTFAAAVSICGAVDPQRLVNMKDIPIRIFHGGKDDVIPLIAAKSAFNTLKSLGADVEMIEFINEGHDTWDEAFAYPDFLEWLYGHKKPIESNSAALAENGL